MQATTPLDYLDLAPVDATGTPVKRRIKDPSGARSLYFNLRQADYQSNWQMARWQAMADGEAPFSQAERTNTGQAYLANFNDNEFKALLDTSLAAYTDLISADESFIEVFTTFGQPEEREMWSQIMSKNMSRVIRAWPRFIFQWAFIPHYFNLHGVGIAYFEDSVNWQWSVTNLGFMKIPRQTLCCEDEIEYGFTKAYVQPHKLIEIINKKEVSEKEGWNIEAVKAALLNTTGNTVSLYSYTELEARWKDNDLVWGYNNPAVSLLYGWVREGDGRYSTVVIPENGPNNPGGNPEEFMCYKQGVYANAQEAFTFFTRGIGTNGTYHSVRGMAADVFNAMQALMRLRNRQVDIAFESGPMWQVQDEEKLESAQLTPWGAGMLVSKAVAPLTITSPLLSQTIQPAINDLQRTIYQNVGTYTSANGVPAEREMSKAEYMGRMEQLAQLSITQISLFNQSMDRLCREIARRFTREGYQRVEPGGHEVAEWRQACIAEGVPEKALSAIDHKRTRAARTIGFGSPAARKVALQQLMQLYPLYDEYGKAALKRDLTASVVGWEKANVYAPPPTAAERPPIDAQIAELQNRALEGEGGEVPVYPNENKRVHLEVHTDRLGMFAQQFDQAGQNPEMYMQIVPPMAAIYNHAVATLEQYTGMDAPQFKQALQNVGEIIVNGMRHIQKLQRQQAEQSMQQGAEGEQQQPGGVDDQMMRQVIENQIKLEQMQKDREARREQNALDAIQRRDIKDMEASAELQRKTAAFQLQARAQQQVA